MFYLENTRPVAKYEVYGTLDYAIFIIVVARQVADCVLHRNKTTVVKSNAFPLDLQCDSRCGVVASIICVLQALNLLSIIWIKTQKIIYQQRTNSTYFGGLANKG